MKRLFPFVMLLFLCTGARAAPVAFTVLQWNVFHGGRGTDERTDLARQINWIAARHPDIVSLNEVTALQADEYRQRLEAATGDRWQSHHVTPQADGIGNQILSRHPIVTTDGYRMKTNGQYRRAVAHATIDLGGRMVNVFSTHLDNASSDIRAAQVRELIGFVTRFPEPRVVAGDLNAAPDAPETRLLDDRLFDAWTEALAGQRAVGYPDNPAAPGTRTRRERIDYILHSPDLTAIQAEVPDLRDWSSGGATVRVGTADDLAVRPSDHNFVFAVLSFSSRAAAPRP